MNVNRGADLGFKLLVRSIDPINLDRTDIKFDKNLVSDIRSDGRTDGISILWTFLDFKKTESSILNY